METRTVAPRLRAGCAGLVRTHTRPFLATEEHSRAHYLSPSPIESALAIRPSWAHTVGSSRENEAAQASRATVAVRAAGEPALALGGRKRPGLARPEPQRDSRGHRSGRRRGGRSDSTRRSTAWSATATTCSAAPPLPTRPATIRSAVWRKVCNYYEIFPHSRRLYVYDAARPRQQFHQRQRPQLDGRDGDAHDGLRPDHHEHRRWPVGRRPGLRLGPKLEQRHRVL